MTWFLLWQQAGHMGEQQAGQPGWVDRGNELTEVKQKREGAQVPHRVRCLIGHRDDVGVT